MDVRLIYKNGQKRRVFRLTRPESVVGRANGCAVRIPSPDVSRTHCRLVVGDDMLTVEDLGSANGTQLNGVAIDGIVEVRPGDQLTVGPIRFVIEYEITEAAEAEIEDAFEVVESGRRPAPDPVFDLDDDKPAEDVITLAGDGPAKENHDLADASQWRPIEGDNLRDLLAQIDQSDAHPAQPKQRPSAPKRKKKREE